MALGSSTRFDWLFGRVTVSSTFWMCTNTELRNTTCAPVRAVFFLAYINTFLKLKAEASEYPSCIRSPEDEERYIENFYARKGVRMDRDAMKPKSAKQGLAKLFELSLGKSYRAWESNSDQVDFRS